jgi:hypothetical protein
MPGQGEFRSRRAGEFLEGFQVPVGVRADKGPPQFRIRLSGGLLGGCFRFHSVFGGEGAAALVTKASIVPILLAAF